LSKLNLCIVRLILLIPIIVFLCGCNSSDDNSSSTNSVNVVVDYKSNTLLNKYDITIFVNRTELGEISQGEKKTFSTSLSSGTNRLRAVRTGRDNNSFEVEFDVQKNGNYNFTANARMSGIELVFNNGPSGPELILFSLLPILMFIGLFYLLRRDSKTEKSNDKILSAITFSKIYSIRKIASLCGLTNEKTAKLINDAIDTANDLSDNERENPEAEKYRILRNARIDTVKNMIILDDNALSIASKPAKGTRKFGKKSKLPTIASPNNVIQERSKIVTCEYCGVKTSINSDSSIKCKQCGAPLSS